MVLHYLLIAVIAYQLQLIAVFSEQVSQHNHVIPYGIYRIGVVGTDAVLTTNNLTANDSRTIGRTVSMTKWNGAMQQKWNIVNRIHDNDQRYLILNQNFPNNFISLSQPGIQSDNTTLRTTLREWKIVSLTPDIWTIETNQSKCLYRSGKNVSLDLIPCSVKNVNQHWTIIQTS